MSYAKQKAEEYRRVLRTKSDSELSDMAKNLQEKALQEKKKENPDKSIVENWRWQHQLVQSELLRRKPKESMDKVEGDMLPDVHPKTWGEKLKDRTLDDLHKLRAKIKEQWDKFAHMKSDTRDTVVDMNKNNLQVKIDAIDTEIKSRDAKASSDAKSDVSKASTPAGSFLGLEPSVWYSALVGAGVAGAIGAMTGRSWIGWGLMGAGVGGGLKYWHNASGQKITPKEEGKMAPNV